MFIKVKVSPKSKKEEIIKKTENGYIVYVKEKAEEGRANQRVREILSVYFKIPAGKIRLIKGGKKPNKIFEIISAI